MMERTCTTLCRHLSAMIGLDAFALLLTRSVNHARGAFPWLGGVMPGRDGTLAGLSFAVEGVGDDERLDGFCAVLSAFFELLIAFIGEGLTLHLIQSVWPDVALGGDIPGQDGST